MAIEKVQTFLNAIKTDPRAKELLEKTAKPMTGEDVLMVYVSVAKELGINVTEEELKDYLQKMVEQRKEKTGVQTKAVEKLADDELIGAAGGNHYYENDKCNDTYQSAENCWYNDGCDNTVNFYPNYKCSWCYVDHKCSAFIVD